VALSQETSSSLRRAVLALAACRVSSSRWAASAHWRSIASGEISSRTRSAQQAGTFGLPITLVAGHIGRAKRPLVAWRTWSWDRRSGVPGIMGSAAERSRLTDAHADRKEHTIRCTSSPDSPTEQRPHSGSYSVHILKSTCARFEIFTGPDQRTTWESCYGWASGTSGQGRIPLTQRHTSKKVGSDLQKGTHDEAAESRCTDGRRIRNDGCAGVDDGLGCQHHEPPRDAPLGYRVGCQRQGPPLNPRDPRGARGAHGAHGAREEGLAVGFDPGDWHAAPLPWVRIIDHGMITVLHMPDALTGKVPLRLPNSTSSFLAPCRTLSRVAHHCPALHPSA
jgi:hypothetical protein